MTRPDVLTRITLRDRVLLAGVQCAHDDLGIVKGLQVRGFDGEEDGPSSGQQLWPSMIRFVRTERGERLDRAPTGRDAIESGARGRRKDDGSVVAPCGAAVPDRPDVNRQPRDCAHRAAGEVELLQLRSGEERQRCALRREERIDRAVGAGNR